MSATRLRSPVVLLALVACACSATARGIGTVPAPARQPSVTRDVVYGHKDGLALTLEVSHVTPFDGQNLIGTRVVSNDGGGSKRAGGPQSTTGVQSTTS
jgi:hypothetical protein